MSKLERISMTIESDLLRSLDARLEERGQKNRSEAVRDLVRDYIAEAEMEEGAKVMVGTLTLIYDHAKRELSERLLREGHESHDLVLSTMHVHLSGENCLEVMALKGTPEDLKAFAERLIGLKGVKHGKLVITKEDA